jgi:hypothetical protein
MIVEKPFATMNHASPLVAIVVPISLLAPLRQLLVPLVSSPGGKHFLHLGSQIVSVYANHGVPAARRLFDDDSVFWTLLKCESLCEPSAVLRFLGCWRLVLLLWLDGNYSKGILIMPLGFSLRQLWTVGLLPRIYPRPVAAAG